MNSTVLPDKPLLLRSLAFCSQPLMTGQQYLQRSLLHQKASEIHQEFIDAVFHVEPPMSAAEQREVFESILEDTLGADCGIEVAQAIHDQFSSQIRSIRSPRVPSPDHDRG